MTAFDSRSKGYFMSILTVVFVLKGVNTCRDILNFPSPKSEYVFDRSCIQVFQLRLSPSKAAEKSNTSAKGFQGISKNINEFISDSKKAFRARIRLFCFARGQP